MTERVPYARLKEATKPDNLAALDHRRSGLLEEFCKLGDLRSGSITATGGRCGNRKCHCHKEGDSGHDPHPRLTLKSHGSALVEPNDTICRLRPVQEALTEEGKKRPRRSSRRSPKK